MSKGDGAATATQPTPKGTRSNMQQACCQMFAPLQPPSYVKNAPSPCRPSNNYYTFLCFRPAGQTPQLSSTHFCLIRMGRSLNNAHARLCESLWWIFVHLPPDVCPSRSQCQSTQIPYWQSYVICMITGNLSRLIIDFDIYGACKPLET